MIVYSNSIKKFCNEIDNISLILNTRFKDLFHKFTSKSEIMSWNNSLKYFSDVLMCSNIDDTVTITLEYNLPLTANRVDLMLTGYNDLNKPIVLMFELKQWSDIKQVDDSTYLVQTFLNGGIQNVVHPGYQIWSYLEILKNYNRYIQDNNIIVEPCLLLHNYNLKKDDIILQEKYKFFMNGVRCFGINDKEKLCNFLKSKIVNGDNGQIIKNIDASEIKPSFKLQNEIATLIGNNKFFNLIDQQILIYDKILSDINKSENNVIIVKGGPGTGESILAINLLNAIVNCGKTCQYVTRNTAPRVVYSFKLKGELKKTNIDFLFKSSGSYTDNYDKKIDVLIVDEAHCLTEKSGLFNNYGINQIMEIIRSSKNSIFFIDEFQQVHLNDIGSIENIKKISNQLNYNTTELSLDYQFRCNGSEDYLLFVDYILGINNDNNYGKSINYDFKIVDTPKQLYKLIKQKNEIYSARLLAGYCWNWNKKEMNNTDYHDIVIDDFEISWNLGQNQTFAIDESINEAGCIHSIQGLEFDYIGVIIGSDIKYINDNIETDYKFHGSADPSFKGIKKLFKENPKEAELKADMLIKNAYRVLLTRGSKGCYIYCQDKQLSEFIKKLINNINFTE